MPSSFLKTITLVFLILLSVMYPLNPGATAAENPVKIRVLMPAPDAAEWKPFLERFHAGQKRIHLEIEEGPTSPDTLEDIYTTSFLLGNSPYDLVLMDVVWTGKFAASGWLQPVDNLINSGELKEFLDGDVEAGRYEGRLYRIPLRSDAGLLYYRQDLLETSGYSAPDTFTQLLEISRSLQKEGKVQWGYLWQGKQYEGLSAMFVEILEGFGGFWVKSDTLEVGLDQPQAISAVKFLQGTLREGISPPGVTSYAEEDTRRIFESGKAAFIRNWPYMFGLANLPDSAVKGKFNIKPMVHAPSYSSGACLGGWGLGIAKSTAHPQESWEVIQYLTSESVQRDFILATSKLPSRKALYNDPLIVAQYPHYPRLLQIAQNSALRPAIAQYAQVSSILQRYLSSALTGRLSPEIAMAKAARETRQLLRR
ncbi:MAG: putative ABC transporter-binding protein [Chroococcopsis gigantea SAG 12.99]|jgi:multiple sugar transport system substrate-binding protein|nr:ABC transporter substrate-binding protein [Chlorogloea purpurea SAG 13.99]MDV3000248.1 putative ABC transporter-binding protein [Chroococcopsis gigantea SAG 12.99]